MDGLTHSLLGLTAAKAGLERLSPYTAAVCIISANAPDIDVVVGLFGDRWTALLHHRGLTHSIVGTLALGILIPSIFWAVERMVAKRRHRQPRIRYKGLLLASLLMAFSHPLMDWTNNYGVRPLLPWSGRWFYGDLVFIIDPYIWLLLGGAAFLLTSNRLPQKVVWLVIGVATTLLILLAPTRRAIGTVNLSIARAVWVTGILIIILARFVRVDKRWGNLIPRIALVLLVSYWGTLAWMHHAAFVRATAFANQISSAQGENFVRTIATPTVANPFRWLCVAETDRAMYRFSVGVGPGEFQADPANMIEGRRSDSPTAVERYEKPSGRGAELLSLASKDRRAQILTGFSRFLVARVEPDNCVGQTLVQFADLRYTEPGASRGNFALDVPVECPPR
ncbi:MAG: metal-dependent hydrolase [Acidobacteriota bacterium]